MPDSEINASIRRLFSKFVLFQAVILAVAVSLAVIFTGYFKQRLGSQLSSAARDAVLSGDARRAIVDLSSSMGGDFYGLSWLPAGKAEGFSVPAGASECPKLRCARVAIEIYFDDEGKFRAGDMTFFYSRWSPLLWGLGGWLILFALSIPVAVLERRRLIRDYNILLDLKVKESYSTLAAQVAHDIKSPLAALGAASGALDIPAEQRGLIDGAVGRIQGIADDLLARYRAPGAEVKAGTSVLGLAALIGQVVSEKKLQYKDKAGVKIEFSEASEGLSAAVEPKEFQRLISNLVNNAVEASEKDGTVSVGLSSSGGKVLIEVKDNGKGIPAEILAKLGSKGGTYGKTGGTGLGLYHARLAAERWGGSLNIVSEPGMGTAVLVELQSSGQARLTGRAAVLLDDDPLVHMNWKMAAKSAGAEFKAYKTPETFLAGLEGLPPDISIYIDSDLGDGVKGEEIAKGLHEKGYADITMATGHGPEKFSHLPWLKVAGKEPPWA